MADRKFWGWGYEGEGLADGEVTELGRLVASVFGLEGLELRPPPRLQDLRLPSPRLAPDPALGGLLTSGRRERAEHTLGKSFDDLARGLEGGYENAPDLVAFPAGEEDVERVLAWCEEHRAAAIPYGGGSSVARGIEPVLPEGYSGSVSIDLRRLDRVLEVDRDSRAARIQAGVLGPALEDQLRPHGLSLRHFPQSFEMSSLGGWIATRSGGHFATLFTHVDEFVESVRAVTPRGLYETRRLPASGAGPDPARLLIGSEGILGVVTEAWMRLQDRPRFRASAAVRFATFESGWRAARDIAQSGLWPANCRLLDAAEAMLAGSGDGTRCVLVVTFESADHALDAWMARATDICRGHGGDVPAEAVVTRTDPGATREGAGGSWRSAFVSGAHRHDAMVRLGVVAETFETAITWDRFPAFHEAVMTAARRAATEVCGGAFVACRFAYVYPDGPAPYYTVLAPGRHGELARMWAAVKEAASEAILAAGGTITHHHAVGRYHRPWYDRERPPLFAEALRAARRAVDPAAIMNPGVLIDP